MAFERVHAAVDEDFTGILFSDQVLNLRTWRGITYECLTSNVTPDTLRIQAGTTIFQDGDGNDMLTINDVGIITPSLQLSGGTGEQGTVTWNVDEETLDVICDGATLQLGQESYMHVRNNTASPMTEGQVIMATGTLGASGRILVQLMVGSIPANAKYLVGVVTEPIAAGADGKITTYGKVRGIDTSGTPFGETWNDGDVLWVSPVNDGELSNVEPTATQMGMPIAIIIKAHASAGTLFVRLSSLDEHRLLSDHAFMPEQSAADSSVAGWGQLWVKDDTPNTLYFTDDTGVDHQLGDHDQLANYLANEHIDWTSTGANLNTTGFIFAATMVLTSGALSLSGGSTQTRGIDVGLGRTGDGISYVDLIGDATYTDYGLRVMRSGGANSSSEIKHRGAGALVLNGEDVNSEIQLQIQGTTVVEVKGTHLIMYKHAFLKEASAAFGASSTYGQYWVKDDTPNIPMFTNDAGTDFYLADHDLLTNYVANEHINWTNTTANFETSGTLEADSISSWSDLFGIDVEAWKSLWIYETAAAQVDRTGIGQLWVKNDAPNTLWFTDDAGTDVQLGVGSGGMADLVDDLTPQLGGNLDVNGKLIDGVFVLNDGSLYVEERAFAAGDTAGQGQFWVRNDVANTPMFTDDAGVDHQLNATEVANDTTPVLGGSLDCNGNNLNDGGVLFMREQAAADVDVIGQGQLWVKTATPNELWFTDDAGTDVQLGAGGSVSPLTANLDGDGYDIDDLGVIFFRQQSAANTDITNQGQLWVKDDPWPTLMFTSDDGVDVSLTRGATVDLDMDLKNIDDVNSVYFYQQASADADIAARGQLWVNNDTDHLLMFTDDSGTDTNISPEEGTWTPVIMDTSYSTGEGQTYYIQRGEYTKIGKMVFFSMYLSINSLGTLSLSSAGYIGGLPYNAETNSDWTVNVGYAFSINVSAETTITGNVVSGTNRIELENWELTSGTANTQVGDVSAGAALKISGFYRTA